MSKEVWVSTALIGDDLAFYNISSDLFLTATRKDGQVLARAGWSVTDTVCRNLRGEPLPADRFPARILGPDDGDYGFMPDLFSSGGYWLVSPQVAGILRGFDLGDGHLYPVRMMDSDFKHCLLPDHYCLNFGAVKDTVLIDGSNNLETVAGADLRQPLSKVRDGDIVVTADALSGPDLWIEAQVANAFFLSGALAEALGAAGLAKVFGLRRCRLADRAEMDAQRARVAG